VCASLSVTLSPTCSYSIVVPLCGEHATHAIICTDVSVSAVPLFIVSMHLTRCDVVSFFFFCFFIFCFGAATCANNDVYETQTQSTQQSVERSVERRDVRDCG